MPAGGFCIGQDGVLRKCGSARLDPADSSADESKPPVTGPAPAGRFVFEEDGMSRECGSARLDLVTPLATSAKRTVCSGTAG